MARLTELEIFDRLTESLRIAAECCDALAVNDVEGRDYATLREHLQLIEGCCIQASSWREDTRWLMMGRMAAECHARAGGWLRPTHDYLTNTKTKLAAKHRNEMFVKLGENLREFLKGVMTLKDTKTGKIGMILPEPPAAERRIGAPVQVMLPPGMKRKGGLLVPKTIH